MAINSTVWPTVQTVHSHELHQLFETGLHVCSSLNSSWLPCFRMKLCYPLHLSSGVLYHFSRHPEHAFIKAIIHSLHNHTLPVVNHMCSHICPLGQTDVPANLRQKAIRTSAQHPLTFIRGDVSEPSRQGHNDRRGWSQPSSYWTSRSTPRATVAPSLPLCQPWPLVRSQCKKMKSPFVAMQMTRE